MERPSGFYAHTPAKGRNWHDLASHLQQTAARARTSGAKIGAGEISYLAGLWHDLGKFNPEFQDSALIRLAGTPEGYWFDLRGVRYLNVRGQ